MRAASYSKSPAPDPLHFARLDFRPTDSIAPAPRASELPGLAPADSGFEPVKPDREKTGSEKTGSAIADPATIDPALPVSVVPGPAPHTLPPAAPMRLTTINFAVADSGNPPQASRVPKREHSQV